MHRRSAIVGLVGICAVLITASRRALAWTLITEDEFIGESKALQGANAPPSSQAGAPAIQVLEPDTTKPIKSPVTIRIRFSAQPGATINPATFRAKYGWLGIDITDRLVGHAQVTASGISADNAEVPAGQYMITLQVADNVGRVGTQTLQFSVA
jgi:hypothetical protein